MAGAITSLSEHARVLLALVLLDTEDDLALFLLEAGGAVEHRDLFLILPCQRHMLLRVQLLRLIDVHLEQHVVR